MSIAVSDARGAEVAGDFTGFPATLASGETGTATFTHVLTVADFARGSVSYAAALGADGTGGTVQSTESVVSGITFEAYATDLDGVAEGGITICTADGLAVTELTIGQEYWVTPGACGTGGDPTGYRVVAFSTPMLLATDSFQVSVPGALGKGAHRIALSLPSGELYGWRGVTVSDPVAFSGPGGRLANTGADDALALATAWAIALAVLGSAMAATAGLRPRRIGTP